MKNAGPDPDPSTESGRARPTPSTAWKRNLVVLGAGQLVTISAMGIVIPLIPFFLRELGMTDRAAIERWSGLIFSGPFLAAALMSPVWGFLGDRYGHKKMVVRAIVGLAVVNLMLVFVRSPTQFFVLRFVQGIVTGFIPAALAITSASTPRAKLTDAMGKLAASASAGRLLGPAIGGVLAGFLAFRELFLLVGVIISLVAVGVVVFLEEPPRGRGRDEASLARHLGWAWREPTPRVALIGLMASMIGISMTMPIFPLYVEDLVGARVDPKVVTGIGFAIVAGFTLLTSSLLGRLAERAGLKRLLVGSMLLAGVALALHPAATNVPAMFAARALLGVAAAGIAPVLITMVGRVAPEGMRGGITGLASSATILGFFAGPITGGWLANRFGIDGVFHIAALVCGSCGIGMAFAARRIGRDREIEPLPREMPR